MARARCAPNSTTCHQLMSTCMVLPLVTSVMTSQCSVDVSHACFHETCCMIRFLVHKGIQQLLELDYLTARGIKLIESCSKESYHSFSQHYQPPKDSSGNPIEVKFSELFWYLNQVRNVSYPLLNLLRVG